MRCFTLEQITDAGYDIATAEYHKSFGHYMFRDYGLKNNVCYEDLKAVRLAPNKWGIFAKPNARPFTDEPMLPLNNQPIRRK